MISQVGFPDRIKWLLPKLRKFFSRSLGGQRSYPWDIQQKTNDSLYSPSSTLSAKKRYPQQNSKPPLQGSPSSPKVYIILELR